MKVHKKESPFGVKDQIRLSPTIKRKKVCGAIRFGVQINDLEINLRRLLMWGINNGLIPPALQVPTQWGIHSIKTNKSEGIPSPEADLEVENNKIMTEKEIWDQVSEPDTQGGAGMLEMEEKNKAIHMRGIAIS